MLFTIARNCYLQIHRSCINLKYSARIGICHAIKNSDISVHESYQSLLLGLLIPDGKAVFHGDIVFNNTKDLTARPCSFFLIFFL
jgi:hypothetical protein